MALTAILSLVLVPTAALGQVELRATTGGAVGVNLYVGDRTAADDWAVRSVNGYVRVCRMTGGQCLAYSLAGKEPYVILSPVDLDSDRHGTLWKLTPPADPEGGYVFQVGEGRFNGWYLQVSNKLERKTDVRGRAYEGRPLILERTPKVVPKWNLVQIAK